MRSAELLPEAPKHAALMDTVEVDVLAYMKFPAQHRVKLNSTNPLKRLNGELGRRTKIVGIFPQEAAIMRLVRAILLEQLDKWARYMTSSKTADERHPHAEKERSIAQRQVG